MKTSYEEPQTGDERRDRLKSCLALTEEGNHVTKERETGDPRSFWSASEGVRTKLKGTDLASEARHQHGK